MPHDEYYTMEIQYNNCYKLTAYRIPWGKRSDDYDKEVSYINCLNCGCEPRKKKNDY